MRVGDRAATAASGGGRDNPGGRVTLGVGAGISVALHVALFVLVGQMAEVRELRDAAPRTPSPLTVSIVAPAPIHRPEVVAPARTAAVAPAPRTAPVDRDSGRAPATQPRLVGNVSDLVDLGSTAIPAGRLEFRLLITRSGRAARVEVIRSTLPREIEGQIIARFYRAEYQPGEIAGRAVDGELAIAVDLVGAEDAAPAVAVRAANRADSGP